MSAITTKMKTKHNTFTVYRDKRKEWRWRLTASNGRILADSGEGYKRKRDCLAALLSQSRKRSPLLGLHNGWHEA